MQSTEQSPTFINQNNENILLSESAERITTWPYPNSTPSTKLGGYDFYKAIGSPKFVLGPMVDQSELAFRLLTKKYGTHLTYTPMFHGRIFTEQESYRKTQFQFKLPDEGPLFVQFCANDPDIFVKCGLLAWEMSNHQIAAVDLNLGCPQRIAKKGRYGSYLMEEFDLVHSLISKAHKELPCPVTAKIRIFEDVELTLKYVDTVVSAGAQILCVHGRTRDQRGHNQGYADWEVIKIIREHVPQIPVFANGNIRCFQDAIDCMEFTGVDGIMSAEGLLQNPALFNGGKFVSPIDISSEYLNICEEHFPPDHTFIKRHLFQILNTTICNDNTLRASLGRVNHFKKYRPFIDHLIETNVPVTETVFDPSINIVKYKDKYPIIKKPQPKSVSGVASNDESYVCDFVECIDQAKNEL
ncbi:hypothetical protein ABK040_011920 [Willaertia magna]